MKNTKNTKNTTTSANTSSLKRRHTDGDLLWDAFEHFRRIKGCHGGGNGSGGATYGARWTASRETDGDAFSAKRVLAGPA